MDDSLGDISRMQGCGSPVVPGGRGVGKSQAAANVVRIAASNPGTYVAIKGSATVRALPRDESRGHDKICGSCGTELH